MGGGGFMHHAASTNRKDRDQRSNRRKKFKGDNTEQTLQDREKAYQLEFPEISEEEISEERNRIQEVFQKRRLRNRIILFSALVLVVLGIYLIYLKTDGFEYW